MADETTPTPPARAAAAGPVGYRRPPPAHAWKKGQSGNPGGRPKMAALRALAQVHTEEALGALVEIMRKRSTPPGTRVAAAKEILDRGWGRSPAAEEDRQAGLEALRVLVHTVVDRESGGEG